METIEQLLKNNKIHYSDIVIYIIIEKFDLKTAKELSIIIGCNYSRLTESLNKLMELGLIERTQEYPVRYMLKDDKKDN